MKNSKDYIGAIFLIFLGTILLFNTTGILNWNVWLYILSYWPIFLILVGLKLILGKSLLSSIAISIVAVLAFTWITLSAYINQTSKRLRFFRNFPTINYTQDLGEDVNQEFTVDKQLYENAETLKYDFNLGVAKFLVKDGIDHYLHVDASYTTAYGEPQISEELEDAKLTIDMTEKRMRRITFLDFKNPEYKISIGSNLPTEIEIVNGVGDGTINLENQQLKNLSIKTGTGDIAMTLGSDAVPSEELSLEVGTGSITLNIPTEVGYSIDYSLGVGAITLDDTVIEGVGQNANDVKSDNFNTAEKILNITADVGVGQLDINFNN